MFENTSLLQVLGMGLSIVLTAFFGWLGKKMKADADTKEALEALNMGVNHTYQGYVRDIKKGNEDGKLTDEESRMARRKAIDMAKSVATKQGLRILLKWGTPMLESLVQDLVNKKKKR